ncbi:MAG: hypothetical protein HYU38_11520 [Candidatus Tectomicrobia bacterium]|nr:hypothetical protein [Candidatus Tectomicrobia bacterium]
MPEPQAVTAVWVNVPEAHREEFRRWHNCEHSTDRLEGPGYACLHRYMRAGGDGRHNCLNVFEGENLEAFDSPYYLRSRNNPTPWTRQCMAFLKDTERSVCGLAASMGERPRYDAPFLYTVHVDPPEGPGSEAEAIAWYREEHFGRLFAVGGLLRARLFVRDERLSNEQTVETTIQDMNPGARRLLALYEMAALGPVGGPAWVEASTGTPRSAGMVRRLRRPVRERWWLDFAKWKTA